RGAEIMSTRSTPSSAAPKVLRRDISPSTISTVGTFSSPAAFALFLTNIRTGTRSRTNSLAMNEPAVPVAPVRRIIAVSPWVHSLARVEEGGLIGPPEPRTFEAAEKSHCFPSGAAIAVVVPSTGLPSGRNQPEALPQCRRAPQYVGPAPVLSILAWVNMPAGKRKLRVSRRKWKRRERIDAVPVRLDRHRSIVIGAARHMLKDLRAAFARVHPVEIERERVDELQLLVILKQLSLVQPVGKLRILAYVFLQPFLACEFAVQHALG